MKECRMNGRRLERWYAIVLTKIFTLSTDNYEALHQTFVKALKVLPVGVVFHMQDIYVKDTYAADYERAGESFLARASERFFNERALLRHISYIYLTRKPANRKPATSAASGLLRRNLVPAETLSPQALREFEDAVGPSSPAWSRSVAWKPGNWSAAENKLV